MTCDLPGCKRAEYGRGLCKPHYKEAKANGTLPKLADTRKVPSPRANPDKPRCKHEGCHLAEKTRGYCQGHYAERLRQGLEEPSPKWHKGRPASIGYG
jgi:hypothetical protein